jgi:pimeloyl-ACP methyl ester carboxylesterase
MVFPSLLFGKRRIQEDYQFLKNRAPIRSIPLSLTGSVQRKILGNHIFLEAGEGRPVVFCHGLFGGIHNIDIPCKEIAKHYQFLMPYQPMYDMALADCSIKNLGEYLAGFITDLQLEDPIVIGSSIGGGVALHYALNSPGKIKGLVLCGSSGLSNIPLSRGYLKRKNIEFVAEATRDIFYDRTVPPPEMISDIFNTIQHTEIILRSIRLTKSATKCRMEKELPGIHTPALLVWGKQDPVTPVETAPLFQELMPDAELHIIDNCGHVPTQEKPYHFLEFFFDFMKKIDA